MTATVAHLYRYPVKGMNAEALDRVDLVPEQGIPGDRRFALALESTRFDAAKPQWLPKTSFLMLMRNARLAGLETRFDEVDHTLTVFRDGRQVVTGRVDSAVGRAMIEEFFAAYFRGEIGGRPKLVRAGAGHMFSDYKNRVLSMIGLASLGDLERVVGEAIDPLRFRANLYVDGSEPWAEFDWVDKTLAIGDVRFTVTARIDRCAATNVRPGAGVRDMNIPKALQRGFGHVDCGVYARVERGGSVACGDPIVVVAPSG